MASRTWQYGDSPYVRIPHSRSRTGYQYRFHWDRILDEAKYLVEQSDGMTLRQLYYRLVSVQLIPNVQAAYSGLSRMSARARRERWFPPLIDQGREIARRAAWESAEEAQRQLRQQFRIDRTEGQPYNLYVAVEKNALKRLLISWFEDKGLPVIALGGYGSQTIADDANIDAMDRHEGNGKENVLIYGHDFDGDGEDLARDFIKRAGCFHQIHQVGLTLLQVIERSLPVNPGKETSPRTKGFNAKYRELIGPEQWDKLLAAYGVKSMQVELDALPPTDLRLLYEQAVAEYWDDDAYQAALDREQEERDKIA